MTRLFIACRAVDLLYFSLVSCAAGVNDDTMGPDESNGDALMGSGGALGTGVLGGGTGGASTGGIGGTGANSSSVGSGGVSRSGGATSTGGTLATGGSIAGTSDLPLLGAFVAVTNGQEPQYWDKVIVQMAALQMKVAIVQTESYLVPGSNGRNAVTTDRLQAVLDAGAREGVEIWMGVALPERGNGDLTLAKDANFIDGVVAATKTSADLVNSRFKNSRAWAGWYLPLEFWTPDESGLGELPRYVDEGSAYLKSVNDLPVLVSPFISTLGVDPQLTESAFTSLLLAADVDVVALQDGVGARKISAGDLSVRVTPWLEAVQRACESAGCETWLNGESFYGVAPSVAALPSNFSQQLAVATSRSVPAISFEFSNYWLLSNGEPGALFNWYAALAP